MPEGPSIVILKEQLELFKGKKIEIVTGNAKIDITRLKNLKVIDFKSWGKHFLICFNGFFLRIHFLMFGTYRINEKKEYAPRLSLTFKNGEVNFYACSIKLIEGDPIELYDWETDIMSDQWNALRAVKAMKQMPKVKACDVLLDQEIFSGIGNIIKNEVLFNARIHPESEIGALSPKKIRGLVKEARDYSLNFYEWKKIYVLKKHWLIYKKKECPRCKIPVIRTHLGINKRLTFFCSNCQLLNLVK